MSETLYQQVYERMRHQIQSHELPVGQRVPVEAELLAEHGVSVITLRRALDMLRDEGFIVRRPRVGTFVVSDVPLAVAAASLPLVGCVVTNFDDSFGARVIGGLLEASEGVANVALKRTLGNPVAEEARVRELVASGARGIILEPGSSEYVPPVILELVMRKHPVVILDRTFDGVPVSTVSSDNIDAGKRATEYLLSLGHTRVGLVTPASTVSTVADRRTGFLHAHVAAGVSHDAADEFVGVRSTSPGSEVSADADVAALGEFVAERPGISAFVAVEHNIAILLRAALEDVGKRVPEDVSIVSFDQPDVFYPPAQFRFTNMRQQQGAMGADAFRRIANLIAGGAAEKLQLPTELVVQSSTAPPRITVGA